MYLFSSLILRYKLYPPNNDFSKIDLKNKTFANVSYLKYPCGIMVEQRNNK